MSTYAEHSKVPITRSRQQIDDLLREWGCSKLGWLDDFDARTCELHFHWRRKEGDEYAARFALKVPHDKYQSQRQNDQAARSAFRVLYLWIKGALNACEAWLVEPEAIFLPWIVGKDGRTVGELLIPQMRLIPTESPMKLIEGGRE